MKLYFWWLTAITLMINCYFQVQISSLMWLLRAFVIWTPLFSFVSCFFHCPVSVPCNFSQDHCSPLLNWLTPEKRYRYHILQEAFPQPSKSMLSTLSMSRKPFLSGHLYYRLSVLAVPLCHRKFRYRISGTKFQEWRWVGGSLRRMHPSPWARNWVWVFWSPLHKGAPCKVEAALVVVLSCLYSHSLREKIYQETVESLRHEPSTPTQVAK